ncbi:MAG: ubiquinol-cytochrome c reductase iron-sulfur subunit [Planctomycetaceae bacterium]
MTDESDAPTGDAPNGDVPRRGFLTKFFAGAVGAVAGLVPFMSGSLFFLDPLLRNRSEGSDRRDRDGYLNLGVTTDALPDDGNPQLFKVYDDVVDAWNKSLNVEVGSVWLRKMPDGTILALSSVCPHLGCAVGYRQSDSDFFCPCHQSAFDLKGREKNDIPPRSMDVLQVKPDKVKPDTNEAIWIKYEKFRSGIAVKKVVG